MPATESMPASESMPDMPQACESKLPRWGTRHVLVFMGRSLSMYVRICCIFFCINSLLIYIFAIQRLCDDTAKVILWRTASLRSAPHQQTPEPVYIVVDKLVHCDPNMYSQLCTEIYLSLFRPPHSNPDRV
jgi:hypothetical protein